MLKAASYLDLIVSADNKLEANLVRQLDIRQHCTPNKK